jgi:hypothetical protein
MVHSIASTTKSNQHRESFPYELCKIQPNCYSNMEMVMRVLMVMMVVMMMMIPMKSSLMVVLMATISPLREGIPSAEICLPKRSFSLGVFRPVEAAESFCGRPRVLGFSKDNIRQRGEPGVGQGGHTTCWRGLGLPAPGGGVGPLWPISSPPSGFLRLLEK